VVFFANLRNLSGISEIIALTNPFSTGKKVKQKKNDKSEAILELMMQGLEIKDSELKERRKDWETLAQPEEREQNLVDFMQLLVKHIVQE
jgi:hypothetical protein